MANFKYSDLLPYVLPELMGCSSPLAELHIRSAVIELCRRAKVWTVQADPTVSQPGISTYDIDLPFGASLVEITSLAFDEDVLTPAAEAPISFAPGRPKWYAQADMAEVVLIPVPDSASVINMTLALQPTRASTNFPAWIAEKYHDAIVAGAKGRLMAMQGHPWSNPQMASFYQAAFTTGVADASASAARAFLRTALRTTSQH